MKKKYLQILQVNAKGQPYHQLLQQSTVMLRTVVSPVFAICNEASASKKPENSFILIQLYTICSLATPLELMLIRTCPAVLRETKHNNLIFFFTGFDELDHCRQWAIASG